MTAKQAAVTIAATYGLDIAAEVIEDEILFEKKKIDFLLEVYNELLRIKPGTGEAEQQ